MFGLQHRHGHCPSFAMHGHAGVLSGSSDEDVALGLSSAATPAIRADRNGMAIIEFSCIGHRSFSFEHCSRKIEQRRKLLSRQNCRRFGCYRPWNRHAPIAADADLSVKGASSGSPSLTGENLALLVGKSAAQFLHTRRHARGDAARCRDPSKKLAISEPPQSRRMNKRRRSKSRRVDRSLAPHNNLVQRPSIVNPSLCPSPLL